MMLHNGQLHLIAQVQLDIRIYNKELLVTSILLYQFILSLYKVVVLI